MGKMVKVKRCSEGRWLERGKRGASFIHGNGEEG